MPLLIQYLIKLAITLALVWVFYQLVLRRLTFYTWNRWFLLGCSLFAFLIPLINLSPALEQTAFIDNGIVQYIPVVEKFTDIEKSFSFNKWYWVLTVFVSGCSVLLIRLIIQHLSFVQLRRSANLILDTPVKVYQVNQNIIPFSFGNAVFINKLQHTEEDLLKIIEHEIVHARQKHSIDMLCAEWLCILNWYNPFAWLIRKSIRQNLEFIADNKVVQNGIDKKQYQHLLLKVVGIPQYSIATNFNFSSLKKRIAMMNKMKSSKVHLIKFLFLVPIVAGLLLAFRNKESYQIDQGTQVTKRIIVDTVPVPPVRSARPAFSQNISSITNIDDHITVKLKDGTTEKYNLNKAEEKAAFERKYGSMPEPSAPPVPPAIENNNSIVPLAPTPPTPPGDVDNVNSRRVVPPQPPVPPVVPNLPANVSSIHINNQNATIKLKNGKVEKYDLGNPDEKRIFEKKYGDVSPGRAPVVPVTPVEQK